MTVNKWVMNIDKKILKCMQMLLKLLHSSVKNVFDRSHNLIGMLLTYVLQDNKLQVSQWVASTQSPQPPSPLPSPTQTCFSPPGHALQALLPDFLWHPNPVGSLFVGYHLMGVTYSNCIWIWFSAVNFVVGCYLSIMMLTRQYVAPYHGNQTNLTSWPLWHQAQLSKP